MSERIAIARCKKCGKRRMIRSLDMCYSCFGEWQVKEIAAEEMRENRRHARREAGVSVPRGMVSEETSEHGEQNRVGLDETPRGIELPLERGWEWAYEVDDDGGKERE